MYVNYFSADMGITAVESVSPGAGGGDLSFNILAANIPMMERRTFDLNTTPNDVWKRKHINKVTSYKR